MSPCGDQDARGDVTTRKTSARIRSPRVRSSRQQVLTPCGGARGREREHSTAVHGQRAQTRGGRRGGTAARLRRRNGELAGAEAVACAAAVECSAAVVCSAAVECLGAGVDGGSATVALDCGGGGEIVARVRSG
jgi:hypothetical protein